MLVHNDYKRLREEVNAGIELLFQVEDKEKEEALIDYIRELDTIVNNNSFFVSIKPKFSRLKKLMLDFIDEYAEEMDDSNDNSFSEEETIEEDDSVKEGYIDNFITNKKYHQDLFGDLFTIIPHALEVYDNEQNSCPFHEDEFMDILEFFMRKLGLFKIFDKFYSEKRIFTARRLIDDCDGQYVCRELSDDAFVFIKNFKYDLDSMKCLIHEFGHVYDFDHFSSVKDYNTYLNYSVYTETIPQTFERLLMQFLLDRNIYPDEVKSRMLDDRTELGQDLYFSFLYSLIDDQLLEKHFNSSLDELMKEKMIKMTENNDYLLRVYRNNSILTNLEYTYGALLAYYFQDIVQKNGFSAACFESIFSRRNEVFSTEFMDSLGVNKDSFKDLIEKEKILLKE